VDFTTYAIGINPTRVVVLERKHTVLKDPIPCWRFKISGVS